ncbi:cytochrome b/b6 domain-containing protein [Aquabacterium sp. A7-Y]|uniref:cytochrome b/b6 domain-containing protein n=1 Tax=Aquabacterium sp. A7-Y TaxID=1349605 RepID=UPI00223DE49D|nr:cytochrome b/b6 domain-containing protein [Aquabacterium sp. A7-Y]MCW7539556.1 cytochrome b/b6 domain-containing protein [Aquabacterium sp. A7-Y]
MKIRVWDLPTRLFHWVLTAAVTGSLLTAQVGGNAMIWHFRLGYLVLTLLLFRLVWGCIGGYWSRFASFLFAPSSLLAHLRGRSPLLHRVGHTPLGSLSVFALLLALAAQVGTGLFADDEIANLGPLAPLVSTELSLRLTWYHRVIGEPLIISLVVLHLCAIAWYTWVLKQSLVRPMIAGDKELAVDAPASRDSAATRWLALAVFTVGAVAVGALVQLGS